jgi:TonB family protein
VARADQGIDARAAQRLGFALAASLLAHGALLCALPRAGQPPAGFSSSARPSEPLQVNFLTAAKRALKEQPAARQRPPRATPVPPRYFAVHELDRRPQILSHVEPYFPALALAPAGRVVLRLYVDETGGVDTVAVESADRTGAFEDAAREAFAAARFLPGMKDGAAVKALVRVEVLFGSPHPDNR